MDDKELTPSQASIIISDHNKQAIELLTSKNYQQSFNLLKKAQDLLNKIDQSDRLYPITYNNLGCFYKTLKKFDLAQLMFEKSLEHKNSEKSLTAGTHLNLSSIFSMNKLHNKALNNALTAFSILQEVYEGDPNSADSLIFAAFVIGKEFEALKETKQAEKYYQHGLDLATDNNSTDYYEKISNALSLLKKKRIGTSKARYESNMRRNELPTINTDRSEFKKQYVIMDDYKKATPRVYHNYPPILGLPYQRNLTTAVQTSHKKTNSNINQIKKELLAYEKKFRKITGTRNEPVARTPKRTNLPKIPYTKPVKAFSQNVDSSANPASPVSVDVNRMATTIQKHWRGYRDRKACRQQRRKLAQFRAQEAIAELEMLKVLIKKSKDSEGQL